MELVCCRNFQLLSCTVLISSLFVLDGASPDPPPPAAGPCSPNPCQNRAICRSRGDGYSCFCVPGFQGSRCQIDVNECVSQPCRNGATCVDRVGRFSCLCSAGFTGATCEVQIDECQSQPCLSGASCHDHVGGFTCTCPPGFQGHRCEINTDECQERPCQNGAPCADGVNEYSCDCSHTAFTGRHCEVPLPPCYSEPCLNGATCQDDRGNYTCACWPGFEGLQCELDVGECASGPCLHGGRCVERSWRVAYGAEPLLPEPYEHQRAAGFMCSCPPGTAGSLCQEVMNQCDPGPCLNGGRCESHVGGYTCHCLKQGPGGILYGGVNCDVRLVGCEGHECQDPGSCSPFLLDGTHGYTCSCSAGFTGPLCRTPTTFSFERRGYLLLQSPLVEAEVSCNITLSFKTVLPRAVLFQRNSGGLLLSLELEGGQLRLTLRKEASAENPIQVLDITHNVTDGEWHSVEAVLANWVLSLKLLGDAGRYGSQARHKVALVQSTLAGPVPPPQNTFIGGVLQDSRAPSNPPLPAFIGCMRDVFVDWQLVVPEEWRRDSAVNVSPGCSHRDRCLDVPCQGRGQCVNLWQSYQCSCSRPYEGQDCAEEHVTARFGGEDSHSFAAFAVTEDLGRNLSVSLFLRTRRPGELLLALAAGGGARYLGVWLEDGRVAVQLGRDEPLRAEVAVDDGEVHFVSVEVREGRVELYVAGQKRAGAEVGGVDVRAGDTVFVGGLTETSSTSAYGGYFKGCIQDLRISDRRLQFFGLDMSVKSFPLQLMENVTAGCSGDNACTTNPCLNGGMCYSMWDDFTCTCPPSTAGRRCEEVRWCELAPCPPDSECRTLSQGYECFANATFLNNGTALSYRGNGRVTRSLTSLSLGLRTRKRNAALLHAEEGPAFVTLSVQDGFLFLELQGAAAAGGEAAAAGGEGAASTVSLGSRRAVSDGEWHSVQAFMAAPWMRTSQWTLVLDEDIEEASTSKGHSGSLDFLREGVDIFVGGLAHDSGRSLAGCLSTVELGGVALSYFGASEVNLPRLQEEQFTRTSPRPALAGCSGASVCEPNPCLNGGECQDLFNAHNCTCAEGWAGRRCDFLVNACASNPCVHGNCSARGRGYECACESGYAGADCEEEVDMCEGHQCAHGGTCLHGPDRYACLCAENYTGPLCSERVEEIPWYIVLRNVRPRLPVSVCGDDTRNYTCFNGGNCTDRELSCDCPPGFTGHRCEQEVDECRSNPCLNGGYCRNLINKFVCVCEMSFAGDTCQTDVSDIYFYVAILLWQNLFQLLSYLIVRLDDQPETKRAPQSAAVLAPCLLGVAAVALALAAAKLRGKRQTEGGLGLRQLQAAGGHDPPAEPGNASAGAPAERLLTSAGLTSDLLLSVSLASVVLLLILIATSVGLVVALSRRATRGAYSPSRQEKEGSRVEMWSITQPPPMERLI